MIYDAISQIEKYKGIYDNLDLAIDYLNSNNISILPLGRTVIKGNDLYVNVVNANLTNENEGVYEYHKDYLDLHIDIDGGERILFANIEKSILKKDYDEKMDYGLATANISYSQCILDSTHFCICMTGELHMPLIKADEMQQKIKKAIIKIRIRSRL